MLDPLLEPIHPDAPCGEDLSFSAEFDEIAELRRADDPNLDQGAWITALKVADWPGVAARAQQLLSQRTKDLRLVVWLTEALTHTSGFHGMAQGLDLFGRLSDRYWDELHPRPDGGDIEERSGNLNWLLQRLGLLAQGVPVTLGRQARLTLADLASARSLRQSGTDADAPGTPPRPTMDLWLTTLRETPTAHLRAVVDGVESCVAALEQLEFIASARWRDDTPSFAAARDALASARADIRRWAQEVGAVAPPELGPMVPAGPDAPAAPSLDAQTDTAPAPAVAAPAPMPAHAGGPIRTRAQALQQLREVADYFRLAEPHSPVAYLADKAVRWGSMPLHEWLRLVVKDPSSLGHVDELLGITRSHE